MKAAICEHRCSIYSSIRFCTAVLSVNTSRGIDYWQKCEDGVSSYVSYLTGCIDSGDQNSINSAKLCQTIMFEGHFGTLLLHPKLAVPVLTD